MEKYMEPDMDLVTFDSEDVIMTSCTTVTCGGQIGICTSQGFVEEPW